ncbi:DUF3054 domain-containing protein [Gryllotalpicola ginsengisoli]|uniref:DUF3054 domain-containing protein n=1 Tax=Gryllotalpicola ginsengisoli TaxID=444608 RepID=UPI0003B4C8B1|nr:DUF3054 domain-containing protein [Gryllotalpicola ginsengisoli]
MSSSPAARPDPLTDDPQRWVFLSIVLDVVLVLLFVVIGRVSHGEDLGVAGVMQTAWPFLVGALLGWAVSLAWRRPMALLRTGVPVWVAAVAIGMLLRVASEQGVETSFVVVASIVLGVFLLGWRALVAPLIRRRARRAAVTRASERARQ